MPLTPRGYTTKQEVEDFVFSDLDPAYDTALDDLIAKAEDFIDRTCRRRFDSYTEDQAVPGNGKAVIAIPDTQTLTSFVLDPYGIDVDTTYAAADQNTWWALEPADAPNADLPYRRLRLLDGVTFPDPGRVVLTGTFGWASVPAAIRLATTMLVAEVTRRWRNPEAGDVSSLTEGNYSVTFAQVAATGEWRDLIAPYKRARTRID